MSTLNDLQKVVSFPNIDVTTESSGICHIVRAKCQAKHGLDLAHFTKHPLPGTEGVPTQTPELDVLDPTADNGVCFVRVKLDIKYLQHEYHIALLLNMQITEQHNSGYAMIIKDIFFQRSCLINDGPKITASSTVK